MNKKISIGDYVLIKSFHLITDEKFNKAWPQGLFGKVINLKQRYNKYDGRKLPLKIVLRVYAQGKKYHIETTQNRIDLIN